MKADDRIIARANKLAKVQGYLYEKIEALQDFNLKYISRGSKSDEWVVKKDTDSDTLTEIACNMSLIEELQKIEKICTK